MSQQHTTEEHEEHIESTPERASAGLRGTDMLAILALSTFLAAVGLTTFFLTTAAGS